MPVNVYAWPPVGAVSTLWTFDQPSSMSQSGLTGAARYSIVQPERRRARVVVSALGSGGRNGAGYSEVLKRLLRGQSNLVRLWSSPINWHLDELREREFRQGGFIDWTTSGSPLGWITGTAPLGWFDGVALTSNTIGTIEGFATVTVSGLPANRAIARPGEFVTFYSNAVDPNEFGVSIMVVAPARTNADGVAVIKMFSTPPYAARVSIGSPETAVFRATSVPAEEQPLYGNWTLPWDFVEVLPEDVGGFTEIPLWWAET